jgi:hypothetical protein
LTMANHQDVLARPATRGSGRSRNWSHRSVPCRRFHRRSVSCPNRVTPCSTRTPSHQRSRPLRRVRQ